MKVTEHIEQAKGKTLFSFEIIPPKKGQNIQELYNNIDPLMEFKPPFIDVTTSREEYVYIPKENGLLERRMTRMRPGTVGICASIKHKYNVDAIPHILCGGLTKEETEYVLVDCHYLGLDNVMALRGDAMKHEAFFEPEFRIEEKWNRKTARKSRKRPIIEKEEPTWAIRNLTFNLNEPELNNHVLNYTIDWSLWKELFLEVNETMYLHM